MDDEELFKKHQKLQREIFKLEEDNANDYRKKLELRSEVFKLGHARQRRREEMFIKQNLIRKLYGKLELMTEQEIDDEHRK